MATSEFAMCTYLAKPAADFQTPAKETQHLPSDRTPPSAMNDTKKIKRSKKMLQFQKASSESNNTTSNINDMRQVSTRMLLNRNVWIQFCSFEIVIRLLSVCLCTVYVLAQNIYIYEYFAFLLLVSK